VTGQAGGGKGLLMVVGMTTQTIGFKTQVSGFFRLKFLICNIFLIMAILALPCGMRCRQGIPGKGMVEFTGIKTNQLKSFSVVFAMACETLLPFYL
jgi:hypothetical protein